MNTEQAHRQKIEKLQENTSERKSEEKKVKEDGVKERKRICSNF